MDMMKVYDAVANWCAKKGLTGAIGDPLPNLLSADIVKLINDDPEAFQKRVRECAYALAMEKIDGRQWDEGDPLAADEWSK